MTAALRYPPVYPYPYYQSRFFNGRQSAIEYLPADPRKVTVHSDNPLMRGRLLSDFDKINIERCGVMLGEWLALPERQMLMNRSGVVVSINYAWDCAPLPGRLWDTVNLPAFWDARANLLATWDTYPVVEHCAVMGHCYGKNYYHFTYETIQELRLFDAYDVRNLVVSPGLVAREFQKDLFGRAGAGKTLYDGNEVVRVVDPVVAQTYQSPAGVHWLRAAMGLDTPAGKRRYYVRRTPEAFRKGNNVSETPEFLALLARYGFETIDFGNGENSIAQQVAMMKDAGVILAAHGAGLTNLGYLTAPLTVIEVFGRDVLSSSFLQLSVCLGFDYHALLCDESDEMQCMTVDPRRLSAILDSVG